MQSGSPEFLVFDIGGTNLRAGIYCADTKSLRGVKRTLTPNHRTMPSASGGTIKALLFKKMDWLAHQLIGDRVPERVALAFAGPIDPHDRVIAAPTIWGETFQGTVSIREELMDMWPSARIFILNDVTAAGYRYLNHSNEDMCIVTVSSGIGHKVFVGGRPIVGPNGRGGEIGHLQVDFSESAPLCDCGGRGHLGAVASGRSTEFQVSRLAGLNHSAFASSFLGNQVDGDMSRVDNSLIVEAFHQKDPWTIQLVRNIAFPLGQALAGIHLTVGVERIVIVGGFAQALGTKYISMLAEAAVSCCWDLATEWERMIELGRADDDAGLVGAGHMARMQIA